MNLNVLLWSYQISCFISVCKDPPYKIEESGYAGFILPIEVYFKNKVSLLLGSAFTWTLARSRLFTLSSIHTIFQEEPKKVRFDYDLFLHLEGHPPVNHLRCEKLTFNNPTEEFRRKLLKAGGVRAMLLIIFILTVPGIQHC